MKRFAFLLLLALATPAIATAEARNWDDDDDDEEWVPPKKPIPPAKAPAKFPPPVSSRPSALERQAKDAIAPQLATEFEPSFCHRTTVPVANDVLKYCPLTHELPQCTELAAACAETLAPKTIATPSWIGGLVRLGVFAFLAIVIIAVIYVIVRSLGRVHRDEQLAEPAIEPTALVDGLAPTHAMLPDLDDPEAILRLGDARARAGQFALALGLYLAAALRSLDRRGAVVLGRDRTNGEYVRECNDVVAQADLRLLVNEVDKVHFGGNAPTADVASVARGYAASLLRVAMMMFIALGLTTGCSGGASKKSAHANALTDPLGHELARSALAHRGLTVESWNKQLDRLGKPDSEDPWLVIDAAKFELGAESRKRVVSWVEAGGNIALFGEIGSWPTEFKCASGTAPPDRTLELISADAVTRARGRDPFAMEKPAQGKTAGVHASLISSLGGTTLGRYPDGSIYAVSLAYGKGRAILVASEESLTNIGLQDPQILTTIVTISDHFEGSRVAFLTKRSAENSASSPMGAMIKAGFGTALTHALIASLLLFIAIGYRLTSAPAVRPDRRRAFVEHIRAVAGLYQRTRATRHALSVFRRFAEERLRQRMPRWEQDVAGYIASRSGEPRDYCANVWEYARFADPNQPSQSADLEYLRALIRLYRSVTTSTTTFGHNTEPGASALDDAPPSRSSTALRISSRMKTDKSNEL